MNIDPSDRRITCDDYKYYESGFHFFSGSVSDAEIRNMYNVTYMELIVEMIIPKGTKVVYGRNNDLKACVAKVFILNKDINKLRDKIYTGGHYR